jgi:Domain of unknown function (DUF4112)
MSLFNCCGIRFGWSSVIGIIPGYVFEETINTKLNKLLSIGDALDAFMAIMVLRTCQQVEGGLPAKVTSKMWFNIILDFCIGLVPLLGDIADIFFQRVFSEVNIPCPISPLKSALAAKGINSKFFADRVPG